MNGIVVNEALRVQLLAIVDGAEVRDEAGNFLGRFIPPFLLSSAEPPEAKDGH